MAGIEGGTVGGIVGEDSGTLGQLRLVVVAVEIDDGGGGGGGGEGLKRSCEGEMLYLYVECERSNFSDM
jgi:hypothetical protein